MSGYFYSSQPIDIDTKFNDLKNRGPDGHDEITNQHGYFFQSFNFKDTIEETKIKSNKHGTLLMNGTVFTQKNDYDWLVNNLTNNLNNNIELIKSLDGDFSLCYVYEDKIIICKDTAGSLPLYFYYDSIKNIFAASTHQAILKNLFKGWYRLYSNYIYIIDRKSYKIEMIKNRDWDFTIKHKTFDHIHEIYEKAVLKRFVAGKDKLLLSSGIDSGMIYSVLKDTGLKNFGICVFSKENENAENHIILLNRI